MATAAGYYYLDGKDLYTTYGIFFEEGTDKFLEFPKRKESITHDWMDSNGIDIDTTRVFFESKEIPLKCAIIADDKEDFWKKRDAFFAEWKQPGSRRLTVAEHERSYYVIYKECSSFERFTRLLDANVPKIACKFTLTLFEQYPDNGTSDVIIVDDAGRYLTT